MKTFLVIAMVALSATIAIAGSLDQIHIKFDRQQVFNEGRQKIVVTVMNTSDQLFKGTVRVVAVDAIDTRVDSDTIFLDDGLPSGGAQKFAILWFKNPERIASLKYEVHGNLHKIAEAPTEVPFEEIGRQPGLNYMSVFVFTPIKDRSSLEKILKIYKQRYESLNGFQVFFFSDRAKGARDLPMSDAALSCLFAQFLRNKSTGKEDLVEFK